MLKKLYLAAWLLGINILTLNAQIVADHNNEFGISIGTFIYKGDLSHSFLGSYGDAKPMVQVFYSRILSPYLSVRLNVATGSLAGNDITKPTSRYREMRGLSFSAPLTEVSALGVWNLFGANYARDYNRFSPYVFAGVGVGYINVNRKVNRSDTTVHNDSTFNANLNRDLATAPPCNILTVPLGLGLKYNLNTRVSLIAEATFRMRFSDYIDGFRYVTDTKAGDSFYNLSVGATYRFGGGRGGGRGGISCPAAP